jgi:hypothetical protein
MIDAFHNNRRVETRGRWEKTSGRWFLSGIFSLRDPERARRFGVIAASQQVPSSVSVKPYVSP